MVSYGCWPGCLLEEASSVSALSPDGGVQLSSGSWGTISEYTRMWVLPTALYSLWSESKR